MPLESDHVVFRVILSVLYLVAGEDAGLENCGFELSTNSFNDDVCAFPALSVALNSNEQSPSFAPHKDEVLFTVDHTVLFNLTSGVEFKNNVEILLASAAVMLKLTIDSCLEMLLVIFSLMSDRAGAVLSIVNAKVWLLFELLRLSETANATVQSPSEEQNPYDWFITLHTLPTLEKLKLFTLIKAIVLLSVAVKDIFNTSASFTILFESFIATFEIDGGLESTLTAIPSVLLILPALSTALKVILQFPFNGHPRADAVVSAAQ